jgi:hypothetical protein
MEDIKPIVGQGHPLDPNRGKLLSADDERRIDDKGRPIVDGKLWGDAATGIYVGVVMHEAIFATDRPVVGRSEISLGNNFERAGRTKLSIYSSQGKPTFNHETVGACFELPDDLGQDATKRQYVVEWLTETVKECFELRKIPIPKDKVEDLAIAVAMAAEKAIVATGL